MTDNNVRTTIHRKHGSCPDSIEARTRQLTAAAAKILAAGALYAAFCSLTHCYIPCLFRIATGLRCPGCGITHCLIALMHGDLREAFMQNQFVFCMLPPGLLYAAVRARRYILYGRRDCSRLENAGIILVAAAAILFGVWRNLEAFRSLL